MDFYADKLTVVQSNADELDRLNELYEEAIRYFRFEPKNPPVSPEILLRDGDLPPGVSRDSFKMYSCYSDDVLAGYVTLYYGYPDRMSVSIGFLYVAEEYRGKGFGKRIVSFIRGSFSQMGYNGFRVSVSMKNIPAIKFWSKNGFSYIAAVEYDSDHAVMELSCSSEK